MIRTQMKKGGLSSIVLALCWPGVALADKPTAEELFEAEREASGCAALAGHTNTRQVSELEILSNGSSARMTTWRTSDDHTMTRMEVSGREGAYLSGFNGSVSWTEKWGAADLQSGSRLRTAQWEADFDGCANPERYSHAAVAGKTLIDGRQCWKVVAVVPDSSDRRTLYFDPNTGLSCGIEFETKSGSGGRQKFKLSYRDHRDVGDGLIVAGTTLTELNGTAITKSRLVEFDFDVTPAPDLTPPDSVRRLLGEKVETAAPAAADEGPLYFPTPAEEDVTGVLQEAVSIPLDLAFPQTVGMIRYVSRRDGKGVSKEGDCSAALQMALDALRDNAGGGRVVFPVRKSEMVDSVECKTNRKGNSTVKLRVAIVSHAPMGGIEELSWARAYEIIRAVQGSASIGNGNLGNPWEMGFSERDGKVYLRASGDDRAQVYSHTESIGRRSSRAFLSAGVEGGNDLQNIVSILGRIKELDGVVYELDYKITDPDPARNNRDETVRYVFERGKVSISPKGSLSQATAFQVTGGLGDRKETPIQIDASVLPESDGRMR